MVSSSDTVFVAIVSVLLAVVVMVTSAIIFLLVRKKNKGKTIANNMKSKRPSLKLDIKKTQLPRTIEDAPSPAYPILNNHQRSEIPYTDIPIPSPSIFGVVPTTPDTPGFIPPQTPGFLPEAMMQGNLSPTYVRSISFPAEVLSRQVRQGEDGPSLLWRSAVSKATRLHAFESTPRKLNRISICPHGKIKFCLVFHKELRELCVRVLDLVDLPTKKESGMSFPFIKIFFLLEGSSSDAPSMEILKYPPDTTCTFRPFSYDVVRSSVLKFVILEFDRFSRTEFMAEAMVSLADVDLDGGVESRNLAVAGAVENDSKNVGSLMISLCYQSNSNRMSVVILKANSLPMTDGSTKPDFFVKITLLRNNIVMDKRRTKVAKKSTCPVFNERLSFPFEEDSINDICFVFDVVRYESRLRHEKNQIIGNVVIGNNFDGRPVGPLELHHFHEMLNSPQKQIAEWHRIVPGS